MQTIFTTSPRLLIPLTISVVNHKLWNPPPEDALSSRVVERDESGRLAKFASRFSVSSLSSAAEGEAVGAEEGEKGSTKRFFAPEADLSFLEGETLQSPDRPLGKRDIMYVPSVISG